MSARKLLCFEILQVQAFNQGCVLERIYKGYVLYSNKNGVAGEFPNMVEVKEALDTEQSFQ